MAGRGKKKLAGGGDSGPGRALPFGVLLIDEHGIVLSYARAEEKRGDERLDDIVGKDFFTEVTPCAHVSGYREEFLRAVNGEGVIARFEFGFPYPNGARTVGVTFTCFWYEGRKLCLVTTGDVRKGVRRL